jgi:hypothetical protein
MPRRIGISAVVENRNLMVTLLDRLAKFNLINGALERLMDIEKDIFKQQGNDGKYYLKV